MAHVTIGDYDIDDKNSEKVKTVLWTVCYLTGIHRNVSGVAGDVEARGELCSCCESAAELVSGCIWFLL